MGLSSVHTDVLGDVILCCWIGNVLGLGITAVVLRVSVRAFSGIVSGHYNIYSNQSPLSPKSDTIDIIIPYGKRFL